MNETRTFESGATRNDDPQRIDWIKMLSLPVLFEYGKYMLKHQTLRDGSKRGLDNWKKGMPASELIESLTRHTLDLAALVADTKPMRPADINEACCAILFNTIAILHFELQKQRLAPLPMDGKFFDPLNLKAEKLYAGVDQAQALYVSKFPPYKLSHLNCEGCMMARRRVRLEHNLVTRCTDCRKEWQWDSTFQMPI